MSQSNEHTHEEHAHHTPSYGTNVMIWLTLVALTALTVTIASVDLGEFTFFVAMLIAAVKAMLVINIFMHVKFDDALMKGIIGACGFIILVIFALFSSDIFSTWGG